MVELAATDARAANAPAPVARSIEKLVSLLELSTQVRLTWVADTTVATREVGALGANGRVVTVRFDVGLETPPEFTALTR